MARLKLIIFFLPVALGGTQYFVSASGSNSNNGTSAGTPWQTISKVNASSFSAGDSILFHGGDTFSGTITLTLTGSAGSVITLSSYGTGNAAISSSTSDGIDLTDSEYVTITNLTLTGAAFTGVFPAGSSAYAIRFLSMRISGSRFRNITVQHCTLSGYFFGISVDSRTSGSDGFDNVDISFNTASNWGNLAFVQGFGVDAGGAVNIITNVYIGHNSVMTGGGINVGSITGLTIERNFIYMNLAQPHTGPGGSCSICVSNSRNFTVNHNEITLTKGDIHFDSCAIDLDQDTQTGEVAYNLTYYNQGPSIQLGSFGGKTTGTVRIHHNISYNDAHGNNLLGTSEQGAIRLWGNTDHTDIFNNTVYMDVSIGLPLGIPSGINFEAGANANVKALNNLFSWTFAAPNMFHGNAVSNPAHMPTAGGSGMYALGNLYDSQGIPLVIANDDGPTYASLSDWRTQGYEKLSGTNYGVAGLALLVNVAGFSPSLSGFPDINTISNFDLTNGSAAVGAGIDPAAVGVTMGALDYHGNPAMRGALVDIGAASFTGALGSPTGGQRGQTGRRGQTVLR